MKRLLLLSLSFILLCFPVDLYARGAAAAAGASGAADGPNTWYYACSDDGAEPSWTGKANHTGQTITYVSPVYIAKGGTLTKLSIYSGESYAETEKLALYDTSGNQLSVSCTTSDFANDTWMDCTLTTSYTVTTGSTYWIGHINSLTPYNTYYIDLSLINRCQSSTTYAGFPTETVTLDLASTRCLAVRAYVD